MREKVRNPLFCLPEKPVALDTLYKDAISVYQTDENLEIYAYSNDDYLDDIRALTEEESISLDVRIAHDLMTRWIHYVKPPEVEKKKKKKSKKWKMAEAHKSMISIAEISVGFDKASSHQVTQFEPSQNLKSKDRVSSLQMSSTELVATTILQNELISIGVGSYTSQAPSREEEKKDFSKLKSMLGTVRHEHVSISSS